MRRMTVVQRVLLGLTFAILCASASAYRNPLYSIDSVTAADPYVMKWLGNYYLYHTNSYYVFESTDLVNWHNARRWSTRDILGNDSWAPSVIYSNGVFYMYLSGPQWSHTILSATSPQGPFQIVAKDVFPGIDGDVFRDDDGQLYFATAGDSGILYNKMKSPTVLLDPARQLTSCAVVLPDEGNWTEGPQMFRINSTYYMTYCGTKWNAPTYQVHAAKGLSIAGLTAQTGNPLIRQTTGDWNAPGHDCVVIGPDLMSYYTVYHVLRNGAGYRKIMVDRLWIDSSTGNLSTYAPTFSDQPNPTPPTWFDRFERRSIGEKWLKSGPGNWFISTTSTLVGDSRGSKTWARQLAAAQGDDTWATEFNVKLIAKGNTSPTPRFGACIAQGNLGLDGAFVFVDPTQNVLSSYVQQNGVSQEWKDSSPLPADWNHKVWHTIRIVQSNNGKLQIYLDGMLKITRSISIKASDVGLVLEDCQAEFGYTAFSNNQPSEWSDEFNRRAVGPDWFADGPGKWQDCTSTTLLGDSRGSEAWARETSVVKTDESYSATFRLKIKAVGSTSPNPRCGVCVGRDTGPDGFYVFLEPERKMLTSYARHDGVISGWKDLLWFPGGFDPMAWHTIQITRTSDGTFEINLDGIGTTTHNVPVSSGGIGFVLEDCQAEFDDTRFTAHSSPPVTRVDTTWASYR